MYMWVACCIVTRYVRLCADVFWALVTYIPYCTILGTLHSLQLTKMMFNRCCQQAEVLSTHSSPCVEFASLLFLLANNTLEEFVYARPLVTVNSAGKTWCREAVARFVWKPLLLLNYRQTWTFTRIYSMKLFTDTRARTRAHTHTRTHLLHDSSRPSSLSPTLWSLHLLLEWVTHPLLGVCDLSNTPSKRQRLWRCFQRSWEWV